MSRAGHARFDAVLSLVIAVAVGAEVLTRDGLDGPRWLNVALIALAPSAMLLARRRRPLAVVAAMLALVLLVGLVATPIVEFDATIAPVLVTAYSLGRFGTGRDALPGGLMLAATLVVVNAQSGEQVFADYLFPAIIFAAAALIGRLLATRARVNAALAERTERLAHEQEARAAQAADEERRRIARELHDVVAHTLSVMVVQAGAARRTLDRDPALAAEALANVEGTGRAALGELRRLLGWVGDGGAPTAPQPTTADLRALVRRAADAGLDVELTEEGAPLPLPAGADVAAYRIAQEALTNALKHAGEGARAVVALRWTREALQLEVRDTGGPAGAALPSGGHGLVGMRERAELYGGAVEAGPLPGGGFAVRARLPLARPEVPA